MVQQRDIQAPEPKGTVSGWRHIEGVCRLFIARIEISTYYYDDDLSEAIRTFKWMSLQLPAAAVSIVARAIITVLSRARLSRL